MDSAEDSPRTVSHPQRANPSVISASLPTNILYDGSRTPEIPVVEPVSNIWSFMHSSSQIAAARNLRGEEAQSLIDLVDQVSGI